MLDRIVFFLKSNNISKAQFADALNVGRSRVSHILTKRNKPNLEFATKMLSTYTNLSPDWLLHGKGNMYRDVETEIITSPEKIKMKEIVSNTKKKKSQLKPQQNLFEQKSEKITKINKIVIFYSDNSSEEYMPRDFMKLIINLLTFTDFR